MKIRIHFYSCFLFFILSAVPSVSGGENIVFRDHFSEKDGLSGWREVNQKGGAVYTVKNNVLNIRHTHFSNGNGGSFLEMPVPVIPKGRLEFDVIVDASGSSLSNGIGLTLDLYNISCFWHDACRDWRMFFAEPVAKRLPNFDIEPVGHQKITNIPPRKKQHYCIKFDAGSDLVEFYVNDMKDPAAARYDVSVLGHAFYQPGTLRIGSYGYAPSPYETEISNIRLVAEEGEDHFPAVKDAVLVFEGISSNHYPMAELLEIRREDMRQYTWDSPGACPNTVNNYQYFKMPSFESVAKAKYIIFNDAPNVHPALQKKILESVRDGAKLLVMGGFFTLQKGGFTDSVIGKELPVSAADRWSLSGDKNTPITLSGVEHPSVLYYHLNLQKRADAEVLVSAGNSPVLLKRTYGKGSIAVFTGTIGGPVTDQIFWKTPALKEIVRKALK